MDLIFLDEIYIENIKAKQKDKIEKILSNSVKKQIIKLKSKGYNTFIKSKNDLTKDEIIKAVSFAKKHEKKDKITTALLLACLVNFFAISYLFDHEKYNQAVINGVLVSYFINKRTNNLTFACFYVRDPKTNEIKTVKIHWRLNN